MTPAQLYRAQRDNTPLVANLPGASLFVPVTLVQIGGIKISKNTRRAPDGFETDSSGRFYAQDGGARGHLVRDTDGDIYAVKSDDILRA